MGDPRAVQWKGTDDSWRELGPLYRGLETVAFWLDDGTLTVETPNGRETVPLGWWIVRDADVIRI